MSRVVTRTYRKLNRKLSPLMSLIYFFAGVFFVLMAIGSLERHVDISATDFAYVMAVMLGGLTAAGIQAFAWITGR